MPLSALFADTSALNELRAIQAPGLVLSVTDAVTGERLYGLNDQTPRKPASVMKLLVSYAALKELGPEYRFATRVLADGGTREHPASVYVIGGGDPSFTIEGLWVLARALHRRGITQIDRLVLDTTAFARVAERSGARAYEASASPMPFNFNSIMLEVCPGRAQAPASVAAEPWEYPVRLTGSVMTSTKGTGAVAIEEIGAGAAAGGQSYRISGAIGALEDCAIFYRSVSDPVLYLGIVLREHLRLLGIGVKEVVRGAASRGAHELYVHHSPPLARIIEDMNHFSTNVVAEQLLMALDTSREHGKQREAALERLRSLVRGWGFPKAEFELVDASGLSHSNRLSARIIARILYEGLHDPAFAIEFERSLSVAGRSGTLKRRDIALPGMIVRGKTGTLDGVAGLAGYVRGWGARPLAFVVLQDNGTPVAAKWALEKKFLAAVSKLSMQVAQGIK